MPWLRRQQTLLSKRTITGRVFWLIRLRWIAAAGLLSTALIARELTPVTFDIWCVLAVSVAVAGYNALLQLWALMWLRNRPPEDAAPVAKHITHMQIAADLVCLVILLQCTGGMINPFVVFMVFHMAIAGIMLPRLEAFLQAGLASALLGCMAVWNVTMPAWRGRLEGFPLETVVGDLPLASYPLYAGSVWIVLSITFFLTVYFTSGITVQLKESYRALAEAYQELHRREATKSQFMRVMAHQLRSPLAAVVSLIHVLDGQDSEDKTIREVHERIQARCASMMELVDDLLRLANIREGGDVSQETELLDFAEVVRATCEEFREQATEKSLDLRVCADGAAGAMIEAVPQDLRDLVGNLVSNAIKYTPARGMVRVEACVQDDRVLLRVADTGIGIPEAEQDKLFQEFFRASNAKKVAAHSSGLGLNICKSVVDRLGGNISFTSQEGKGTTFEVRLPITACSSSMRRRAEER